MPMRGSRLTSDQQTQRMLDREARDRKYQEKLERIKSQAKKTAEAAKTLSSTLSDERDLSIFLSNLSEYLLKIIAENDYTLMKRRAKLIQNFVDTIQKRDATSITTLLEEENIKEFNSIFGHRFYDILRSFQNYPWNHSVAIANAMNSMPASVVHLVNQYGAFFCNRPMQYNKEKNTNASQDKNKLNTLPEGVMHSINGFLDHHDQESLIFSARDIHGFLQPVRPRTLLLTSVVTGNENMVVKVLTRFPDLVVEKGEVSDKSRRTFLGVSAAELVKWGDDWGMANAMLNILLKLRNKEHAKKIINAWYQQDAAYDLNGGLNYMVSGSEKPIRSLKFNLTPLLNELQAYIDGFGMMTLEQRAICWRTKVGAAQFLLPAVFLQHYCQGFCGDVGLRTVRVYNYDTGHSQGLWETSEGHIYQPEGIKKVTTSFSNQDFALSGGCGTMFGSVVSAGLKWLDAEKRWATTITAVIVEKDVDALRALEMRNEKDSSEFKQKLQDAYEENLAVEQDTSRCSIS